VDAGSKATGRNADAFVISRVFDARRELMWKVWTDPEHLAQWWGPKGFTITNLTNDARPGGIMHYCMNLPNGEKWWGKFTYREVAPEQRLVYLNSFSDPDANTVRAPFLDKWPLEMLTTVTFEADGDQTRVTVSWIPWNADEEEAAIFDKGRDSMRGGWTGTFDMLAEHLKAVK
jgi:uncharacterized protein YndB with AHSA1/START domain